MPLSQPQKEICQSAVENRFVVSCCGRRFGKTHVSLRELARAASKPDQMVYYVAPSYRMAKTIVWDQLKSKLKELRWIDQSNEAELKLRLKNGSVIYLKGADNPESLLGVGLNYAVLDEYQDIDPKVWYQILRPTLSDKGGRALFIGTPRGVGSFSHQMYTMAQSTDGWAAHTYTTLEGGNVPEEEIEQAKRDMDEKTFQQEYCATWNTYSGQVYYNFSRDYTVKKLTKDNTELHCGIDFNVDPMSVCVCVIEGSTIYIVDELNMMGSNTDEVCDEIKRRYPGKKIIMYPDPAGRQRKTSAGGRTDISILQNAGFKVNVRNSHTPIRDRVNAVNAKLKNTRGEHTLFVDPKCKQVINSLERLVYKPNTSVIEKDGNDHMSDAIGYLVDFLFPLRTEHDSSSPSRWAFSGNTQARSWN